MLSYLKNYEFPFFFADDSANSQRINLFVISHCGLN